MDSKGSSFVLFFNRNGNVSSFFLIRAGIYIFYLFFVFLQIF